MDKTTQNTELKKLIKKSLLEEENYKELQQEITKHLEYYFNIVPAEKLNMG